MSYQRFPSALVVLALGAGVHAQQFVRSVNGPAANAQFGKACIVVPDQNADGFKDLIVGAPSFNQERGEIVCVSGAYLATGVGSSTLWSLAPSANQGDLFGFAIADVGDVTNDGVHDFLVGQPGFDVSGSNDVGAVRLVSGAAHTAVSTIHGTQAGLLLGYALAATGDVNGDGRSEALVGGPALNSAPSRVYQLMGSAMASSSSISLLAVSSLSGGGAEFGVSIVSGFSDSNGVRLFAAGEPGFDLVGGADAGSVFLGAVTTSGLVGIVQFASTVPGERLGSSITASQDYDGDGVVDIVVGAPNATNSFGTQAGRVAVLSSSNLINHTSPYELYSLSSAGSTIFNYHFGAAVLACDDLNGDGVGEILVGAPDYATAFNALGRGFVAIHSGATGTRLASIVGAVGDHFGDALAGAVNDLDGDGFKEFVFSGALADVGGTDSGVIECYRLFPLAPAAYCTGKVNSLGCTPQVAFSGTPSANPTAPFLITATNFVNQKNGLLFYSHAPTAAVFQGGTKCVANPTVRTPPQNSHGSTSGSSCSGVFSFDFNDWIVSGWDASLVAGSEVYAQYWARDPGSASHTSLSNALRFLINP